MEKGVRYNMCKAWDDHKESGRLEGRQDAINESLVVLIDSLKNFYTDIDTIYNTVIKHEIYKDVSREQIKKYYYINESEN